MAFYLDRIHGIGDRQASDFFIQKILLILLILSVFSINAATPDNSSSGRRFFCVWLFI